MFAAQQHRVFREFAKADALLHRLNYQASHHDHRGHWFYRNHQEVARIQELPTGRVRIDFGVSN